MGYSRKRKAELLLEIDELKQRISTLEVSNGLNRGIPFNQLVSGLATSAGPDLESQLDEQKRIKDQLRRSELNFRMISETSQAMILIFDPLEKRTLYINPAFINKTGYTADEALAMEPYMLMHPEDRTKHHRQALRRLRGGNPPNRYETRFVTKDGDTVWVDISAGILNFNNLQAILVIGHDISERIRAESARNKALEALQASERSFRDLTFTAPVLIWVCDLLNGRFLYVNSFLIDTLGYSHAEYLEMSVWDFIHPDYRSLVRERATARFHGEKAEPRYEICVVKKNGELRWLDMNSSNVLFNGEKAIMSAAIDVTERKEAEQNLLLAHRDLQESNLKLEILNDQLKINYGQIEALNDELTVNYTDMETMNEELQANYNQMEAMNQELHSSNQRLEVVNSELFQSQKQVWEMNEELLQSQAKLVQANNRLREKDERLEMALWAANEAMWDINLTDGSIFIDDTGHDLLKMNPEMMKSNLDTLRNRIHPDDRLQVEQEFWAHVSGRTSAYSAEYRLRRDDGSWIWVWIKGRTIERDETGRSLRMLGLFRDVSERRQLEENLRESRRRYQDLFEQSPIGLLKCSSDGTILDVNQMLADLFKFSNRSDLVQQNVFTFPFPAFDSLAEHLEQLFSKALALNVEVLGQNLHGEIMWLAYKLHPLLDDNNNVIEAIIACENISLRKQSEEKIRYLSYFDSLTGVYNRAYLDDAMQYLDKPSEIPLSIIMGDVNGLKLVNDAFGHSAGDRYLLEIAGYLKQSCRAGDILARWGGDEFVILMPRTGLEQAYEVCDNIRACCQSAVVDPIQPSIALGAQVKISTGKGLYEVLGEAEDAMYRNKLLETSSIRNSIMSSLSATLHERTFETREHTERLRVLSIRFARELALPASEVDKLTMFAALHDIGKMGIPDDILCKPGPLDPDEWEIIKRHPEIGYRIIQGAHELSAVSEEILSHHEHWDGQGYPKGLCREEIPYLSRILSVVDAYDVMTNERPYKSAMSHQEAVAELKRCSGRQFEPVLVDRFIKMFSEANAI